MGQQVQLLAHRPPLFGAVLGIVAFFIYVVIVSASGTLQSFRGGGASSTVAAKDFIIFCVVAFLVGYREETFRELIKRATDLILKPGTGGSVSGGHVQGRRRNRSADSVSASGGAGGVDHGDRRSHEQRHGSDHGASPQHCLDTGWSVQHRERSCQRKRPASGQSRTVDVVCTPGASAAPLSGTLTLKASNLTTPKTMPVAAR